jgi:hypothetical protein
MQFVFLDGVGPLSVEFVGPIISGSMSAGGGTVAGVSLGDPVSGRKVIIAVHAFGGAGTNPTLSAATINSETAYISGGGLVTSTNDPGTWFIGADVAAGTTASIFLNFSTAVGLRLAVYRMTAGLSITRTDDGLNAFGFTSSDQSANADVLDKGVQFAAATVLHDGGSQSITAGISSPSYGEAFGSGGGYVMGGFELITANQTGRTITIAKSGGAEVWRGVLNTVSHR